MADRKSRIDDGTAPPGWGPDNADNNGDADNADSAANDDSSIDLRDEASAPRADASSQSAAIEALREQLAALLQSQQALAQQMAALVAAQQPAPPPPALIAPPSPAPRRQPPPAAASPVRPPAPLRGAASPAAHRQGALGAGPVAAAELHALIDGALREPGADGDDDDDAAQVSIPSHQRARALRASFLPDGMMPTTAGTGHDNAQLIAEALSTVGRKTSKYANFTALKLALEQWKEKAVREAWSAERLISIVRYHDLIVHDWGAARFQQSSEYHRLFIKAFDDGRHDMFRPDGHLYLSALHETGLMNVGSSPSVGAPRGAPKDKSRTPGRGTDAKAPASGKHPAGSCANHPDSTTHTTAECRRK